MLGVSISYSLALIQKRSHRISTNVCLFPQNFPISTAHTKYRVYHSIMLQIVLPDELLKKVKEKKNMESPDESKLRNRFQGVSFTLFYVSVSWLLHFKFYQERKISSRPRPFIGSEKLFFFLFFLAQVSEEPLTTS